ncbi:MAG: metallophosphoesterase [Comamonadaceae bacterium]|nr:MAG: metallophosphoesterase [Comamonadaceae bacterium]
MPRIALISDTHNLLRPEALAFLAGCDHIVHGGDIGGPDILARLSAIAPLSVVRGNNDHAPWASDIPVSLTVVLGGVAIHAVHDIADLDLAAAAGANVRVVVSGHSHKPSLAERDGVLFINPGSAGPRRFSLPISVGELLIDDGHITPRLVTLDVPPAR